ncbi:gtpase crac1b [Anaeramoeba flamelloides]|uniref:Gtpase crac1b n=1 Tax=Anaeramoeba flamelloides TaxID=1746091 RepID=A0AAV7Z857_9EUKA|nr:gtpase crac1b [Anaeramoeba flamelloides]KAJ6240733.1 gtpase crac1b [Anaeramoeba flamelloides]
MTNIFINCIGNFNFSTSSKKNTHDATHNNEVNALAATIQTGTYPETVVPMEVHDNVEKEINGTDYNIHVEDTLAIAGLIEGGQKERQVQTFLKSQYTRHQEQVWLLVFSVGDRETFDFIEERVFPHLQYLSQSKWECNPKCILVGSQSEKRKNKKAKCVDSKEAKKLAKKLGCQDYCEVSATTQDGFDDLFETIEKAHKGGYPKTKKVFMKKIVL